MHVREAAPAAVLALLPRVFLSFLGLPALLLTHSLNPQEVEKQRTTQRLVGHEPSASSLAGVWPPQENV